MPLADRNVAKAVLVPFVRCPRSYRYDNVPFHAAQRVFVQFCLSLCKLIKLIITNKIVIAEMTAYKQQWRAEILNRHRFHTEATSSKAEERDVQERGRLKWLRFTIDCREDNVLP